MSDDTLEERLKKRAQQLQSKGAETAAPADALETRMASRKAPPTKSGFWDSAKAALSGAAQGGTLGFADEALGAVNAGNEAIGEAMPTFLGGNGRKIDGATIASAYREGRDKTRAVDRQASEDHPVAHIGGEVGGGLATGALLEKGLVALGLKGLPTLSTGARIARAGAEGAAIGGATGAGSAEGDLSDRAAGALKGAGIGAVAGSTVGAASPLLGRAARAIARTAGVADAGGGTGVVARAARKAGVEGADDTADRKVIEALNRDELTPSDVRTSVQAARAGGEKPESIIEHAGSNTQRLARGVRTLPGKGSEQVTSALNERHAGAEDRVLGDLMHLTGTGNRTDTFQLADELIAQRAKNAEPLYSKAFANGSVDDPDLSSFLDKNLKHDEVRNAWERAKKIARYDGVELPHELKVVDVAADGTPEVVPQQVPNVQALHYLKLGLDDVINSADGIEGGSRSTLGGKVKQVKRGLLDHLDALVPDYKAARAQFAGDSDLMDALGTGRQLFKLHPDEIAKATKDMTPGELDLFRKGGAEALADRIESVRTGGDVGRVAEKTLDQKRIRHLFPDDAAFDGFKSQLQRELKMAGTRRAVTGGSQTADKLADVADFVGISLDDLAPLAHGDAPGVISRVARKVATTKLARATTGNTDRVTEQLGQRLTAGMQNPADLDALLDRLDRVQLKQLHKATRSRLARGASAAAALSSGSPSTP